MRQFYIFLMQGLLLAICGLIDTAFGNQLGIDSICVLSSYTIISWVTYSTYSLGTYGYRVILNNKEMCLVIQMIISLLISVLLYPLCPYIANLYTLTASQKILFVKCLQAHLITLPALALGEFLSSYIQLHCMNKCITISNILFYIFMIASDATVVIFNSTLDILIWCTGGCYIIYSFYIIIASKFFKTKDEFNIHYIKDILKHGGNVFFDRITGKVATIVYNIFASKLGTELYAVHSVCYALAVSTENYTNSLYTYQVVKLSTISKNETRFKECKTIMLKCTPILIIMSYIISFIILIIIHGDADLRLCLIFLPLYNFQCIALLLYESHRAFLTSTKQSQYLRYGGICGILVRIPIAVGGYYLGLGLLPFALGCSFDFLVRGIYYYSCSRKFVRNNKIDDKQQLKLGVNNE